MGGWMGALAYRVDAIRLVRAAMGPRGPIRRAFGVGARRAGFQKKRRGVWA